MGSSFGRVPEQAPERFLVATEACGGGTPDLSGYSMVLGDVAPVEYMCKLLSAFWERGVPRLACLRPAAWLKEWPSTAHLRQHKLETLARVQASRGRRQEPSSGAASSGWLTRRRRDQGGVPHEVPVTQAMTIRARRAPVCAESLFPLWCKGGKRRQGYQAKATISVQQDQDQQDGRAKVIVEPKPTSLSGSLAGEDQL